MFFSILSIWKFNNFHWCRGVSIILSKVQGLGHNASYVWSLVFREIILLDWIPIGIFTSVCNIWLTDKRLHGSVPKKQTRQEKDSIKSDSGRESKRMLLIPAHCVRVADIGRHFAAQVELDSHSSPVFSNLTLNSQFSVPFRMSSRARKQKNLLTFR